MLKLRALLFLMLLCLVAVGAPRTASAQQPLRSPPSALRTIADEAGVLSGEEVHRLSESIGEIRQRTGVQVAILLTLTTRAESVRDHAERWALRWERENALNIDRSVFVVVALKDREMVVLPGNALAFLDEEFARPGAYGDLAPLFRGRRYFEALTRLNARLLQTLQQRMVPSRKPL